MADYHGLSAKVAEGEAARAAVPEAADGYELKLPEDFEGPEGFEFVIDESDESLAPIYGEIKAFAHEAGLNQEQFSKMLAMAAKKESAEYAALQTASKQQMESLGTNGTARVDAVTRWLSGHLGEEGAKSLLGVLFSKTQVEAYESLMRKFSSHGVPAPTQQGGTSPSGGKPDVGKLGEIKSGSARIAAAMAMAPKAQK